MFVTTRHQPGGLASVNGQTYRMLQVESARGERRCQNDAMLLCGIPSGAKLNGLIQIEENPPIPGGSPFELTDEIFIVLRRAFPMNPAHGIVRSHLARVGSVDRLFQRTWICFPFARPSARENRKLWEWNHGRHDCQRGGSWIFKSQ